LFIGKTGNPFGGFDNSYFAGKENSNGAVFGNVWKAAQVVRTVLPQRTTEFFTE